jgi:hypothetical protein
MIARAQLKKAIVALLDSLAEEHPLAHQNSKAARYVLVTLGGAHIELMFEKNDGVSANLWCLDKAVARLTGGPTVSHSPASALYTKQNDQGETLYGRHSSLKKMPQLGRADLVCFRLETLREAGMILDHLLSLKPADIE